MLKANWSDLKRDPVTGFHTYHGRDIVSAVKFQRLQAINDGQAPPEDHPWWDKQHPDAVFLDPSDGRAKDVMGNRIDPSSRRPWTCSIEKWQKNHRELQQQKILEEHQKELDSLRPVAAGEFVRGYWDDFRRSPHTSTKEKSKYCADNISKIPKDSQLCDILSKLGKAPQLPREEPISDAELLAVVEEMDKGRPDESNDSSGGGARRP